MTKKTPLLLLTIVISVIGSVIILLLIANRSREQPTGFTRIFLSHPASSWKRISLQYPHFYIAGATKDRTYLSNTTAYGLLFSCTHADLDTSYLYLKIPEEVKLETSHLSTFVDSPDITLLDAVSAKMLRGTLDTQSLERIDSLPSGFYEALPIGSDQVVATIYDTMRKQTDLSLLEAGKKGFAPANVLTKKIDGRFCTSGRLFSDDDGQMVYVYFYRNQYIVLDSLLHITQLGKTIDTITQSPLELGTIDNGQSTTFAKPPLIVNRWGAVANGKLYILSNIKADNEKLSDFKVNNVFDVYDIEHHRYDYSFHLPMMNNKPVQQFIVRGKYLIALSGQFLMITTLNVY